MRVDRTYGIAPLLGGCLAASANSAFALDTPYVLGASGKCVGMRFAAPPGSVHLHKAYFFLSAVGASAFNLTCDLVDQSGATKAGTLLNGGSRRTVTTSGGTTATKWVCFDFTAYSDVLTPGTYYWVVVGDTLGSDANHGYSIRTKGGGWVQNVSSELMLHSSTTGFSGNGTIIGGQALCILEFSDGTVYGNSLTSNGLTDANNTNERGIKITGLTEKILVTGLTWESGAVMSTIRAYNGTTAPGGTIWSGFNGGSAYTISASEKVNFTIKFPTPFELDKGQTYRFTFTYASSSTSPGYYQCDDTSIGQQLVLDTMPFGGYVCRTIDNGAGGWTDWNNTTDGMAIERISLLVGDQVAFPTTAQIATAVWGYANRTLT